MYCMVLHEQPMTSSANESIVMLTFVLVLVSGEYTLGITLAYLGSAYNSLLVLLDGW